MKKLEESPLPNFTGVDKNQMEQDVRSILEIEEDERPVILNLESIRVTGPGKFELDLVSLMNRKPIVFKLEEGKYLIDLDSGMPTGKKEEG